MKKSVGKGGVSPVVASSLMVLLVLVLATIVFLWAKGFIGERIEKFGQPIEEYCERVNLESSRDGSLLQIVNTGDVDVRQLDIKMSRGGNSEVRNFDIPIDAGDSASEYITFEMSDGTPAEKVVAYPALVGKEVGGNRNSVFTCTENGITL